MINHLLMAWGIEDVGPVLDVLDGMSLTSMTLSTSKAIRQDHRMSFARCLRHVIRLFRQAENALQAAPVDSPNTANLVTNLERVTKLLHITPALLQSSD